MKAKQCRRSSWVEKLLFQTACWLLFLNPVVVLTKEILDSCADLDPGTSLFMPPLFLFQHTRVDSLHVLKDLQSACRLHDPGTIRIVPSTKWRLLLKTNTVGIHSWGILCSFSSKIITSFMVQLKHYIYVCLAKTVLPNLTITCFSKGARGWEIKTS